MSHTIDRHRPTQRHEGDSAQVFHSLIGKGPARMVGDANKIAEASQPTRPNQVRDNFAMGSSNPLDALLGGRRG